MRKNSANVLLLAALLAFSACAPQKHDIEEARSYRMGLAPVLGLAREQVLVEAGYGVTNVTIYGVQSQAERARIAADLVTLNKNNPKMNPLKWTFSTGHIAPVAPQSPVE